MSCGSRLIAAALIARSCRCTDGSHFSSSDRWCAMIAQYVRTAFGSSWSASGSCAVSSITWSKARMKSSWRASPIWVSEEATPRR